MGWFTKMMSQDTVFLQKDDQPWSRSSL